MNKPFSFICISTICKVQDLGDSIEGSFDIEESISAIMNLDGVTFTFDGIEKILYNKTDDKYYIYYNASTVFSLQSKNSIMKIEETKDGIDIKFEKILDGKFPKYRTEIIDGELTTYCTPGQLLPEFVLLKGKSTVENIIKFNEIMNGMYNILYELHKDFYNINLNYYIYYNDMIYSIENIGTNVMYVKTVPINEDDEPQDGMIPYYDLINKNYIFNSEEAFLYHDVIIKDGSIVGNKNDILLIYDENYFSECIINDINNRVNYIRSMIELIEKYNETDENQSLLSQSIISFKENIETINEYIEEFNNSDICSRLGTDNIIIYRRGNFLHFSIELLQGIISDVTEYISKIDIE